MNNSQTLSDTNSDLQKIVNSLSEIGSMNSGNQRIQRIQAFLSTVCTVTNADRISIYQRINSEFYEQLYAYDSTTGDAMYLSPLCLPISKLESWKDFFYQKKAIIADHFPMNFNEALHTYQQLTRQRLHSMIAYPLTNNNHISGCLVLENPDISQSDLLITMLPLIGTYLGSIRENYQQTDLISKHIQSLHTNRSELEKDRQFLDVLCKDYTAVYYLNLNTDTVEPLKLDSAANVSQIPDIVKRSHLNYTQMMNRYCKEYVSPLQQQAFLRFMDNKNLRKELAAKERFTYRFRSIPNLSGQQFFEAQIVRISDTEFDGNVLLAFHHIDDILLTEQKRQHELEDALEKERISNEILSAISKIYYSIFRIDLEKDTYEEISSDEKVHHLTGKHGKASTEMIELCNNVVVPEYRNQIMQFFNLSTLAERLENEETIATEYLAVDGNWHTARFIVKRRNEQGRVTHVLYVTRLISDSKRREQNWIMIAEEANKANEAKTEFLSQMAHDIRTPLNAILGFLTITESHIDDPEQVKYGLDKIRIAGEFLHRLVDDVLDLSRIENGQMKVHPENLVLRKFLNEIPVAFEHDLKEKSLHFHYHIHDLTQEHIIADPLRLKQIYSNILSNAVKYTPNGGTIDFEVFEENLPDQKVRLTAVISDTGIGMSKEYLKKLYSKFSRETDTRINKVSGYGLGLSIVKYLTDLMHGTIGVKSELGQGTTFRITFDFPYAESPSETDAIDSLEHYEKICSGMHLLVAEDNDLNYEVIEVLLGMHNITCERAADGAICVEKCQAASPHTYDAILMDMQMPNMNGLEATMNIRKLSNLEIRSIPIIAMTANAFQEDIQKCLNAGMNSYLSKPVDIQKLLKELALSRTEY